MVREQYPKAQDADWCLVGRRVHRYAAYSSKSTDFMSLCRVIFGGTDSRSVFAERGWKSRRLMTHAKRCGSRTLQPATPIGVSLGAGVHRQVPYSSKSTDFMSSFRFVFNAPDSRSVFAECGQTSRKPMPRATPNGAGAAPYSPRRLSVSRRVPGAHRKTPHRLKWTDLMLQSRVVFGATDSRFVFVSVVRLSESRCHEPRQVVQEPCSTVHEVGGGGAAWRIVFQLNRR